MHSGAFSSHFDMKVSSMSRKFSISARYSGFMTYAERPALVLPGADAFRLPECIAFVMFFSFPPEGTSPQATCILHYFLSPCQGADGQKSFHGGLLRKSAPTLQRVRRANDYHCAATTSLPSNIPHNLPLFYEQFHNSIIPLFHNSTIFPCWQYYTRKRGRAEERAASFSPVRHKATTPWRQARPSPPCARA